MIRIVSEYFLVFYIYSVVGYFCEVINIYRTHKKVVWNRGYLLGPYLPIFGFGALIITLFLADYKDNPLNLFILGMFYCGTLEYFTSLILEKIFKLRWWDYSYKKFNINGRICLETSVLFGIGAIVLVRYVNELLFKFLKAIPNRVIIPIAIVIFIIMVLDTIISTIEVIRLKKDLVLIDKDATAELKEKIRESLQKNYYYYVRILKAFPNLKHTDERIKKITDLLLEKKKRGDKYEK